MEPSMSWDQKLTQAQRDQIVVRLAAFGGHKRARPTKLKPGRSLGGWMGV